jgi:hypothetical protein
VGFVIDTSALVTAERGGEGWQGVLGSTADEAAVIPAIVYAELL